MERDEAYLLDMLIAARDIQKFSVGLSPEAFDQSRLHQLAMVRLIEIIGEAARNVSNEMRSAHPEIEWSNIIGMRNRVVHQYNEVNYDIVWSIITTKAPELVLQLEPIIPPDTESPE